MSFEIIKQASRPFYLLFYKDKRMIRYKGIQATEFMLI
jgi:hypothetical protein